MEEAELAVAAPVPGAPTFAGSCFPTRPGLAMEEAGFAVATPIQGAPTFAGSCFPTTSRLINDEDAAERDHEPLSPLQFSSRVPGAALTHYSTTPCTKTEAGAALTPYSTTPGTKTEAGAPILSFAPIPMGSNAWEINVGEPSPGTDNDKSDRRESMKMYMRNYRRRQKATLDSLSQQEREIIQQRQRERVRQRVRRHRMRKKLRSSGLEASEVEKRLSEFSPTVATPRQIIQGIIFNRNQNAAPIQQMAICLDMPLAATAFTGQNAPPSSSSNLRCQLPEGLATSNPPFLGYQNSNQNFCPGQPMKLDFDQRGSRQEVPFRAMKVENDDGRSTEMKLLPSLWTTSQVGVFLEGLELGNVKSVFERYTINGVALMSLTSAQLCDMGIGPVEIRDALLNAIDSLKKVSMFN